MIRQLGSHTGKTIVFGYDRHLLPELDFYLDLLQGYGRVEVAVDHVSIHYLSSAKLVCQQVQGNADRVGVLCCGTGMGMSIAANKFRHIYASRCVNTDDAASARIINNSNVLCLASSLGAETNGAIIKTFMTTAFEGRKLDELAHITQFELEYPSSMHLPIMHLAKKTA